MYGPNESTDDLIDQILKETQSTSNWEYDKSEYNCDAILKECQSINTTNIASSIDINSILNSNPQGISSNPLIESKEKKEVTNINTSTLLDSTISSNTKPKEEEEIPIPVFDNPLDFINYIEIDQTKAKYEKDKNNFILKNYKNKSKLKFNVLEIEPQIEWSRWVFQEKNILISTTKAKENIFYTGNNIGDIKLYSMSDKKELQVLTCKETINHVVNCIEFTSDGLYLLAGYDNGYIAMFEISTGKCKKKKFPVHCKSIQDGVASLTSIKIYKWDPEITLLFTFDKPSFIKELWVPDATIGIGKPPISSKVKSDDIKQQLLMSISWGKVIYVFLIPIMNNIINEPIQWGYFVNTSHIWRMGFLTGSILFFFDVQKFFKVINTREINIGELEISKELKEPVIPPTNSKAQWEDGRLVEAEMKYQTLFKDKESNFKPTYVNYMLENTIESTNYLHLAGKKTIYNGKLLGWENCLNSLQKNNEWLDLLSIGIEIYQARMSALAGIPQEEATRKAVVGNYLRAIISQYVIYNTSIKRAALSNSNFLDHERKSEIEIIQECIDITIEFCIEIESVDYLLTTIQPIFDSKDYGQLFLSKLEPFILCDKIINVRLSEDIIYNIIELYKKKKKYDLLAQLLIHLNIENIDNENIKSKCEEMKIVTPLIYIYMNGKKEDYFTPVQKLFDQYWNATEIPNFIISDYDTQKGNNNYNAWLSRKKITEVKVCRQYVGHKLFWYINWCLEGKKFPNENKMIRETFKKFVTSLTYWLLTQKVFYEFIKFDAKNYFLIWERLFSEKKWFKIISEANSVEKEKIQALTTLYIEGYEIHDIEPTTLVYYLVNQCNEIYDDKILMYLYYFIAKCANFIVVKKELAVKACDFIVINYSKLFKEVKQDEVNELSNNIIKLLENRDNWRDVDYQALLVKAEASSFDLLKWFWYQKLKSYTKCFELYLSEKSIIPNKSVEIYKWINTTLLTLSMKEKNKSYFSMFKTDIMNNICEWGKISIDELFTVTNLWYPKERKVIWMQLESTPEIQWKYVEIWVQQINQKLKENENNLEDDDSELTLFILKLHIKLLCSLNQHGQIITYLKKNPLYDLYESLQMCLKYKVNDAAIYLYQSTGASGDALKLSIQLLEKDYRNILENLAKREGFSDNTHVLLLEDFSKKLVQCVGVCEHNDQQNDELWFSFLDKLYSFFGEIQNNTYKFNMAPFKKFESLLSINIKELLEKMCSYVSIKRVIDKVTEKYKNAEFKEFKELLTQMLISYSNQSKILWSAQQWLSNFIFYNENDLIKQNKEGKEISFAKCDECGKLFNKSRKVKEEIVIFNCGHISHKHCVLTEKDNGMEVRVCRLCRKIEIDNSVGSSNIWLTRRATATEPGEGNEEEILNKSEYDEKRTVMNRLRGFDKKMAENKKLCIVKSVEVLKEEMRKYTGRDLDN